MMKKYFFIFFIVLAAQAFSQGRDEIYTPNFSKEALRQPVVLSSNKWHLASRYKKMQIAGALALSGGVLAAGGGLLVMNSVSHSVDFVTVFVGYLIGGAITAVGTAGTITGCVFFIRGSIGKYQVKQLSISVLPAGVRIAYTF
jgi:hypothetical protein